MQKHTNGKILPIILIIFLRLKWEGNLLQAKNESTQYNTTMTTNARFSQVLFFSISDLVGPINYQNETHLLKWKLNEEKGYEERFPIFYNNFR